MIRAAKAAATITAKNKAIYTVVGTVSVGCDLAPRTITMTVSVSQSSDGNTCLVGTGKADVTPYASYYLSETGREKIVVRLKQELAALGLSRTENAREPEDHFAGLFEAMRHLVSGSDDAALQKQKRVFIHFIAPAYSTFCAAISHSSKTNFYRCVGDFARVFLDIESESLKVF